MGNTVYGISKAATDKTSSDMAHELRPHGVTVVSLYPGLVRTEAVMAAAQWLDLSNSESPEFIGKVIAGLNADPHLLERSGEGRGRSPACEGIWGRGLGRQAAQTTHAGSGGLIRRKPVQHAHSKAAT